MKIVLKQIRVDLLAFKGLCLCPSVTILTQGGAQAVFMLPMKVPLKQFVKILLKVVLNVVQDALEMMFKGGEDHPSATPGAAPAAP